MLKKTLIITLSCLLLSSLAEAEIYNWKDALGNTIYSDQKPSADAIPAASSSAVNYYQPASTKQEHTSNTTTQSETLATLTPEEKPQDGKPELTEDYCQQHYNRNCEQVSNWLAYAKQHCGDDQRCKDPDFLERKYRPRTNDEIREIALISAIRNNNQQQKIALFLTKKYTNYCQNQAEMLCRNKLSRNCLSTMKSHCDDPRDLNDIFNRYDNLDANEKRAIIAKAKNLATSSGEHQLNYEQVLASLIEILISQAMLGM